MRRVAVALGLALIAGSTAMLAQGKVTTALSINQWRDAVRHHTPGQADDAVLSIERLTLDDRRALNADMTPFLRALGKSQATNLFLERAAVLHGDVAILGFKGSVILPLSKGGAAQHSSTNGPPLLFDGSLTMENDGEVVGMTPSDWNWVFARSLLDLRDPKHADDAFVGAWYHATTSFMFQKRLFGEASRHLRRAAALLPDDPRILFDRACYAEMQGLPRSQQVLNDENLQAILARQPRGGLVHAESAVQAMGVLPVEVTNGQAEQLFRRSLELDPHFLEARVRLARLLAIREQWTEALTVLHAAPMSEAPIEPAVAFYAHLFSARVERGLGHLDAAAAEARHALSLFPDAQSALMASSQIAMLRNDPTGAEEWMRHLASLPPETGRRSDPWWLYDIFTGRNVESLLTGMWAQAPSSAKDPQ